MLSQEKLIRITFYNGIKSSSRRLLRCFALAVSAGDGRSNPQFWPESEASRSSPERYPIAGMMDQSPCEARGSPDQRRGARSASVVIGLPGLAGGSEAAIQPPRRADRDHFPDRSRPAIPALAGGVHRPDLDHPRAPSGGTQGWTEIARPSSLRPGCRAAPAARLASGSRHSPPHVVPSNWTPTREGGLY
jgi:hypothetical protein